MNKSVLYLASSSSARQKLLRDASIDFEVITHRSDESVVHGEHSLSNYVLAVAQDKARSLELPALKDITCFVLSADTLVQGSKSGTICGKPTDRLDAERMLRLWQKESVLVATGCYLECIHFNSKREQEKRSYKEWVTSSMIDFVVDDESFDDYFHKLPGALSSAGAGIIEGFGMQFVKKIEGSYSSVMGLPLFEVRQALEDLGFWK